MNLYALLFLAFILIQMFCVISKFSECIVLSTRGQLHLSDQIYLVNYLRLNFFLLYVCFEGNFKLGLSGNVPINVYLFLSYLLMLDQTLLEKISFYMQSPIFNIFSYSQPLDFCLGKGLNVRVGNVSHQPHVSK